MSEDIREQVRQKCAQVITSKSGCYSSGNCCGGDQQYFLIEFFCSFLQNNVVFRFSGRFRSQTTRAV